MTDVRKTGGPAFPFNYVDADGLTQEAHPGMTLRDWFAGQALAGYMGHRWNRTEKLADDAAEEAYRLADAMLREREK